MLRTFDTGTGELILQGAARPWRCLAVFNNGEVYVQVPSTILYHLNQDD